MNLFNHIESFDNFRYDNFMQLANKQGNGIYIFILIIIIIALIITGIFAYKKYVKGSNALSTVAQQNTGGVPQARVIDTAPQIPSSQKSGVLIMQSDSTYIKYLVPTNTLNTFIHTLPSGTTVISQAPLQ